MCGMAGTIGETGEIGPAFYFHSQIEQEDIALTKGGHNCSRMINGAFSSFSFQPSKTGFVSSVSRSLFRNYTYTIRRGLAKGMRRQGRVAFLAFHAGENT